MTVGDMDWLLDGSVPGFMPDGGERARLLARVSRLERDLDALRALVDTKANVCDLPKPDLRRPWWRRFLWRHYLG